MKKIVSVVLTVLLLATAVTLIGCKPAQSTVQLGLGSVSSIADSKDATDAATPSAQTETTVVAVALDKDGKILAVSINTVQPKVNFDSNLKLTSDTSVAVESKKELGPRYDMKKASAIGKEWDEQITAFEEWMVGKTVAEVKGLKVKEQGGHTHVPDDPELTSSVTITVKSYIEALEKAAANTVEVKGYNSLGLGLVTSIASSKDAAAQADVDMVAAAFDKNGKVVGVIIDVVQPKVAFDEEGKVTSDKSAAIETKKELKERYNMKKSSPIGKEWYEQAAALEEWMVGKTVSDITGMKLGADNNPDVPELTASVTMTVDSMLAAVEKAFANKK